MSGTCVFYWGTAHKWPLASCQKVVSKQHRGQSPEISARFATGLPGGERGYFQHILPTGSLGGFTALSTTALIAVLLSNLCNVKSCARAEMA